MCKPYPYDIHLCYFGMNEVLRARDLFVDPERPDNVIFVDPGSNCLGEYVVRHGFVYDTFDQTYLLGKVIYPNTPLLPRRTSST